MCGNTLGSIMATGINKAQLRLSGRKRENVWSEHAEPVPSVSTPHDVNTNTATQDTTAVKHDNVWSDYSESAPSGVHAA